MKKLDFTENMNIIAQEGQRKRYHEFAELYQDLKENRAHNQCEICGKADVVLGGHHIIQSRVIRRIFNESVEFNRPDNIIVCCWHCFRHVALPKKCHLPK